MHFRALAGQRSINLERTLSIHGLESQAPYRGKQATLPHRIPQKIALSTLNSLHRPNTRKSGGSRTAHESGPHRLVLIPLNLTPPCYVILPPKSVALYSTPTSKSLSTGILANQKQTLPTQRGAQGATRVPQLHPNSHDSCGIKRKSMRACNCIVDRIGI